jgi:hypothetical protein
MPNLNHVIWLVASCQAGRRDRVGPGGAWPSLLREQAGAAHTPTPPPAGHTQQGQYLFIFLLLIPLQFQTWSLFLLNCPKHYFSLTCTSKMAVELFYFLMLHPQQHVSWLFTLHLLCVFVLYCCLCWFHIIALRGSAGPGGGGRRLLLGLFSNIYTTAFLAEFTEESFNRLPLHNVNTPKA